MLINTFSYEKNIENLNKNKFKLINRYITRLLKINNNLYFEVIFINDKKMKEINFVKRKINKTTDVISCALNDSKKSIKTDLLGEIFINIDAANRDCKKLKISLMNEIYLLYIHGILHLLGYDHNNKTAESKMFKLQNKILDYAK